MGGSAGNLGAGLGGCRAAASPVVLRRIRPRAGATPPPPPPPALADMHLNEPGLAGGVELRKGNSAYQAAQIRDGKHVAGAVSAVQVPLLHRGEPTPLEGAAGPRGGRPVTAEVRVD